MKRIVIVEDDRKLNDGIVLALKSDLYAFSQYAALAGIVSFFASGLTWYLFLQEREENAATVV